MRLGYIQVVWFAGLKAYEAVFFLYFINSFGSMTSLDMIKHVLFLMSIKKLILKFSEKCV